MLSGHTIITAKFSNHIMQSPQLIGNILYDAYYNREIRIPFLNIHCSYMSQTRFLTL